MFVINCKFIEQGGSIREQAVVLVQKQYNQLHQGCNEHKKGEEILTKIT
jgi:hypothetical protein